MVKQIWISSIWREVPIWWSRQHSWGLWPYLWDTFSGHWVRSIVKCGRIFIGDTYCGCHEQAFYPGTRVAALESTWELIVLGSGNWSCSLRRRTKFWKRLLWSYSHPTVVWVLQWIDLSGMWGKVKCQWPQLYKVKAHILLPRRKERLWNPTCCP